MALNRYSPAARPSRAVSWVSTAVVAAVWILLRLVVFESFVFPLTYALPLLLCIWTCDKATLWIMAAAFAVAHTILQFRILPAGALPAYADWATWVATMFNIVVGAAAVHAVILMRQRLEAAASQLDAQADELARQNEELAQQSEELSSQSEEMSSQMEELSQQSEELSRQNEELQAQSEEINSLNVELGHREGLLQALLESARVEGTEQAAMQQVCRTAKEILADCAHAVVVYEQRDDRLLIRGAAGLDEAVAGGQAQAAEGRFAHLAIEQNRTACLNDASLRPDLGLLEIPGRPQFRSVLCAPLQSAGRAFGAVAIYSRETQEWTAQQFRIAEWLAARSAHILEILRLQETMRRQAALLDLTPDGIMVRQMDGTITAWGHGAEVLYGWTKQEAIGARTHTLLRTRFPQPLAEIDAQLERDGRWSGELIHATKDGREVVVQSRWLARRDASGAIAELLESNVDLSEVRRIHEALTESETRYSLLFRNLLDGFAYCRMLYDEQGRPHDFVYLDVNPAFATLTGLEDVVGRRVTEVIPGIKESNPELFETYGRVASTGRPEEMEIYVAPLEIWLSISVYSPERGCFVAVFDNITERKRAEDALRRSEERLRVATTAAEIGVWSWVPGTSQVNVSANWRRLFGVAADTEATFETWRDALHPDDRDRAVRELNEASDQHREFDTEYRVVHADGTVRWLVDRGRATYDEAGRAIGMAGINIDVTDRKQAEDKLREADRRKNEFLATLSHELRNPLAPIRYALELIDRDHPVPSQPKMVIERQLAHLVRLIDDLLDITRIASNKIRLRRQRAELSAIVQQAVESTMPDIEQAGHALLVSLPPDPIWLDADMDRLAQVLTNLLANAARYTPEGGRISLTAAAIGDDVVVSVSDTGVGLSGEDLGRVFEMFAQVGDPGHGGLGIGLALVKGLVEMHGGSVEARSAGLGHGSEFRVRLPRASAPAPEAIAVPEVAGGTARRRILVVDDNADSADMMKTLLEMHGHEVHVAYDGVTALETARRVRPEIGLFDIGLPGITGYDLARELRSDPANGHVFLVAVTGWGQEDDRQRARQCGFDAHLTKPADPDQLTRLITEAGTRLGA